MKVLSEQMGTIEGHHTRLVTEGNNGALGSYCRKQPGQSGRIALTFFGYKGTKHWAAAASREDCGGDSSQKTERTPP